MIGDDLKVRRLAMEVRQLASARQITVMDGVSGGMYVCSCIRKAFSVSCSSRLFLSPLCVCEQRTYKLLLYLLRYWEF